MTAARQFVDGQRVTWKCGGLALFGRVIGGSDDQVWIACAGDVYWVDRAKVQAA